LRFALAVALFALLGAVFVASAMALRFDDGTPCIDTQPLFKCPSGTIGAPYSVQLVAHGGCEPHWRYRILNGSLPGGLSLSSSGLISGTPNGAGEAKFWVELADIPPSEGGPDWCSVPKTAEREFSITINAGLSIGQNSVPAGTVGQAYSQALSAMQVTSLNPPTGPQVAATWSVQSGTPPPGVTLAANGLLAGSPTTEGTYQFVVRAVVGGLSDTETLSLTVRQPLAISAARPLPTSPTSVPWEVGVPFSAKLTASGGTGTYTWTIGGGSLPTGFALAADGTLAGTTRTAGSYQATLRLSDNEGRTADYDASFLVASRLAVSTLVLKPGKVGRLYRARVSATGGVVPKTWKIVRGPLPRGIRFDRTLGLLSGTPTKARRYRVTFQVTDALKVVALKTLRIDVLAALKK
jgi:hypothetical protein